MHKLKKASKPVSIEGICYPNITMAGFYARRYQHGPACRQTVLNRLRSDDPKWAEWKYIPASELPEPLPSDLVGYCLTIDHNCFIHHYGFVVMRYVNDKQNYRNVIIGGVVIGDQPVQGDRAVAFELRDGTYLNISGVNMPKVGTPDYAELQASMGKYLASKNLIHEGM